MAQTIPDKFNQAVRYFSNNILLQYKKDSEWVYIRYKEFNEACQGLSGFLLKEGIEKGDNVLIFLHNCYEWPLLFFSLSSLGAVIVTADTEAQGKEIQIILEDCDCVAVFTDDRFFKKIAEFSGKTVKRIYSIDSDEFKAALNRQNDIYENTKVDINENDIACILYTSGTTALPKGVMLTHKNLLSDLNSLMRLNLFKKDDSMTLILPLYHAYSLTTTMLLPSLYGIKIIFPESLRSDILAKTMQETNPDIFVAVPLIFELFYNKIIGSFKKIPQPFRCLFFVSLSFLYEIRKKTHLNIAKILFSGLHRKFGKRLRFFVSGGAKLDEIQAEMFFRLGFTILEGYGLSESGPVLTLNPLKKPKISSAGIALPDVEIKIKGENNIELKAGLEGEVIARGPNIMKGYYKKESLTKETIKGGWLYTQDIGYLDREGYLFITGRIKEIIVLSSGLKIYPQELEELYSKSAPIKEICVFGISDASSKGESSRLWAIIVPEIETFKKYGETNLKNVIQERFKNVSVTLAPFKRISGFSLTTESLPRTTLGKIKRYEIREMYLKKILAQTPQAKEISEEDKKLMEDTFAGKIIDYLKEKTNLRDISPGDLLENIGIDSLGRIELACAYEKLFNQSIKEEAFTGAFTVKDLIRNIKAQLTQAAEIKNESAGIKDWAFILRQIPNKENLRKIDLNPGFNARMASCILFFVIYGFFKIFYRLKVSGRQNIPEKGPFILYANHANYFDGFLVAIAQVHPRTDLFFVGLRFYFDVPVIRSFIKIMRVIPLDFSSHLLEALKSSYFVLANKKCLCVFPEGIRTLNNETIEFKKGFGILAKEADVPLVPVLIEGSYEAWPRTRKLPKLHPIKLTFGQPFPVKKAKDMGYVLAARDDYEAIGIGARKILCDMKEKEQKVEKSQ